MRERRGRGGRREDEGEERERREERGRGEREMREGEESEKRVGGRKNTKGRTIW